MPTFALCICLTFITWLLVQDCRRRQVVSAAVWIPTILLLILGSRPVSLWAAGGKIYAESTAIGGMGNDVSGSPLDLLFFVFVIGGSLLVASSRGFKWGNLFAANRLIALFYFYFALSVCWSGDPEGSIKRIIKDFGLLFVISVIFSERDPLQAMRAVYVRCAIVLLPLSAVLIKYFPSYSRVYAINGDILVTGVTTQKNSLGETSLVLTLFLVWDYLEQRGLGTKLTWRRIGWDRLLLLLMAAWLLQLSQSKTALVCTILGSFLIARSGLLVSKAINRIVLAGALSLPFLLFFSQEFSSVIAPLVQALGRNMTFTGRANIWEHITIETVNPFIGSGYWNFWGGRGGYAIATSMNTSIPNAHCGYVDLYLDGGIIGLILLFMLLVACGGRILKNLTQSRDSDRYQRVRYALLITAIIYNLSEAHFARKSPICFTTLLMIVEFPRKEIAKEALSTARHRSSNAMHDISIAIANQYGSAAKKFMFQANQEE